MKGEQITGRTQSSAVCQSRAGNRQWTAVAGIAAGFRIATLAALTALALAQGSNASAGEATAAGRIKADQVCANCHGLDGQAASGGNSAMSPKLTAQRREYLVARLQAYRSGSLQHPQMTLVARMISEQDIEDVADWYSSLEIALSGNVTRSENDLDPGALAGKNKAEQVCKHCHGIDGRSVPDNNTATVPYLSGQPREYLVDRILSYRSGRIDHPQMTPIAQGLSEQEIKNVSEWYSGIEVDVLDFD
jgi:cytochrome c553